jgi:hypothetical protein
MAVHTAMQRKTGVFVARPFLIGRTSTVALIVALFALFALIIAWHLLFACLAMLLAGGGEVARRVRSRTSGDATISVGLGAQSFPSAMSDLL